MEQVLPLSPGAVQLFDQLEKQITDLNGQIHRLMELGKCMKEECFDEEDQQMVLYKIQESQQIKQSLEYTLAQKKDIYNTQVKVMERQLQKRKRSLEDLDERSRLFETFPDILKYFVQKQTRLEHSLQGIKEKLQQ